MHKCITLLINYASKYTWSMLFLIISDQNDLNIRKSVINLCMSYNDFLITVKPLNNDYLRSA